MMTIPDIDGRFFVDIRVQMCYLIFCNYDRSGIYASGSSSVVERELPKLDVAGSIPVSRSTVLSALIGDGG